MTNLTTFNDFNDLMVYVNHQKNIKQAHYSEYNDKSIEFWKIAFFKLKNLKDEDIFYQYSYLMSEFVFLCYNIEYDYEIFLEMCLHTQHCPILTMFVSIMLDSISDRNICTHICIVDTIINNPNFDVETADKYLNLIYNILDGEVNGGTGKPRIHGPYGAAIYNLYDMFNIVLKYYNQQKQVKS
jgi:hypothetical protein